jgi:Na+-transporting methylmalonyl-CoA/oxaloacetate decarboxylase gamma subunit
MKNSKSLKTQLIPVFAVLTAIILFVGLASSVWSAEQKSEAPPPPTNSVPATTNSAALKAAADIKAPKRKHQITGAELYSMHCNRCHPERYPTERTAAQWKTILLHMQVRVNLPEDQAKLILKYLQDNSGR